MITDAKESETRVRRASQLDPSSFKGIVSFPGKEAAYAPHGVCITSSIYYLTYSNCILARDYIKVLIEQYPSIGHEFSRMCVLRLAPGRLVARA